jgi:hypothetical protein
VVADEYFDRDGLYGDAHGDFADNAARFAFFAHAVVASPRARSAADVVHCHDWQTGSSRAAAHEPGPELARVRRRSPSTTRLPRRFGPDVWPLLGLDRRWFTTRTSSSTARQLPEGRLGLRRSPDHREPAVCRGDPDSRARHGLDGVLRERGRSCAAS